MEILWLPELNDELGLEEPVLGPPAEGRACPCLSRLKQSGLRKISPLKGLVLSRSQVIRQ